MSTSSVATLSELRTLARQYSDMVNSNFVTDSEFNAYLNLAYFELYDILIQKYGDDYFVASPYSITTDGTSYLYALPSDFYKMIGLDLQLGNSDTSWVTIKPFMFIDRNRYATPNFQSFYGVTNLRYRLSGGNLFLTPTPSSGQTLRLWYLPKLSELTSDGSTVNGISGWQDYLPIDAAIKALAKEESDTSALQLRKNMLIQRIESAAEGRDAGSPQVVGDSQWSDMSMPNGGNTWGGY